ncbi:MAG: hypothetical protein ACI898_001749, partial [Flavobacteriales bacterium]
MLKLIKSLALETASPMAANGSRKKQSWPHFTPQK